MHKKIELPELHVLEKRLIGIDPDTRLQQLFYPALLLHSGTKMATHTLVTILVLAIQDYTSKCANPFDEISIVSQAPQFVEAMFADREAASHAKQAVHEALRI